MIAAVGTRLKRNNCAGTSHEPPAIITAMNSATNYTAVEVMTHRHRPPVTIQIPITAGHV